MLIVIAILGILAAVIIPNINGFLTSGNVAAANSELSSIQTGLQAYNAENPNAVAFYVSNTSFVTDTTHTVGLDPFLSGAPVGTYCFIASNGMLILNQTQGGTKAETSGGPWYNGLIWNGTQFHR